MKLMGSVEGQIKSIGTWGFWHGCPSCLLNRDKPIGSTTETLASTYEETIARLQNIKEVVCNVVSIWGASLENCCSKIQS